MTRLQAVLWWTPPSRRRVIMKNPFPFSIAAIAAVMLDGVGAAAFGQDVVPAVGPASSGVASSTSTPVFSGLWAHPFYPRLELPFSGPAPLTNTPPLQQSFSH